jgi:hypothetical protein
MLTFASKYRRRSRHIHRPRELSRMEERKPSCLEFYQRDKGKYPSESERIVVEGVKKTKMAKC